MSITTLVQVQLVDSVGSIVATDITQDSDTSLFIREFRVYSVPDGEGNITLLYTLRVSATAKNSIELTAPAIQF